MQRFARNILILLLLLAANLLPARNVRDTLDIGSRLQFSENKGQWDNNILFRTQMGASTLWLEPRCFTFLVQDPANAHLQHVHGPQKKTSNRWRYHVYKLHFLGSETPSVEGLYPDDSYENYFIGNDPSRWASHVRLFSEVNYSSLYPGIDMRVHTSDNYLKYDFLVAPGANPDQIAMQYEGIDKAKLQNGNVVLQTSVLDIVELQPYAYQTINGQEVEIASQFVLDGPTLRIQLGSYDHSLPLVIDPYLHFSSYTGSTADNWGTTAAYDSYKNTYTAGLVLNYGSGYPTSVGAFDTTANGNADIGIFKLDTNGHNRLYATYLGGSYADMPHSMFVNAFDELVIFGTTGSPNFPVTPSAYDTSFNGGTPIEFESSQINYPQGSDIFVSRFSADGSSLMASTFAGGFLNDGLNYRDYYNDNMTVMFLGNDSLYANYGDGARGELITDDLNNIYVGTTTFSFNIQCPETAIQRYYRGGQEGLVLKFDHNLSNLLWSTYLGGSGDDAIYSIDVDSSYNLLVCGGTCSHNFPTTPNAYSTSFNGGTTDGFVSKISRDGTTLMSSTLFGSNAYDQCYFVRCGKQNDVFLFGQTKASGSTLVHNANYNTPNSGNFLARFRPNLDTLIWSTVFGTGSGEPNLSPTAFMADVCNRVYIAGWGRKFCGYNLNGVIPWRSTGTWGMTVTNDAFQSVTDGQDFYIMTIADDASQLLYASFFGEPHDDNNPHSGNDHVDGGTSRFDKLGTLYQSVCASCGHTNNFPTTPGAWSSSNCSNNCNNAIFRINISDDFPVAEFVAPTAGCAPHTIQFHNTGRGSSFHWDFGDGSTSTAVNPSHTYSTPGTYTITLIANLPGGCKSADTTSRTVMVIGHQHYHLDTVSACPGAPFQIGMRPMLGCTYRWIDSQGHLSDTSIANPATGHAGTYTLIVSNGDCEDTVQQVVILGHAAASFAGDTSTCSSPITLDINSQGNNIQYFWSSNRNFSDTLNHDPSRSSYEPELDSSQWFYYHVIDQLGCEETDSVYIHFTQILDSIATFDALCPGSCDGRVEIYPGDNAQAPYLYSIDLGTFSDDIPLNNLCPGYHWVSLQDAHNCKVTKQIHIGQPDPPTIVDSIRHVLCHEESSGEIHISVIGPYPPYNIAWADGYPGSFDRQNLAPGTYIANIDDARGCHFPDTLVVLENADFTINIAEHSNTCPLSCSGSATAIIHGGVAPYLFNWTSGNNSSIANDLCEGWNIVTCTDATGCLIRDSVLINRVHSFDSIEVWADRYTLFQGESTDLHSTQIPNATYAWTPTKTLSHYNTPDPTATPEVNHSDTTTYYLTITDSVGCIYQDSLKIECIYVDCGEANITIPNAFTPNGDGHNDRLCIHGEWVKDFYIAIFTRWGELVYESTDINACWDGRYKDNWCIPGVYTYRCKVTCEAGQEGEFKGDVTLIR